MKQAAATEFFELLKVPQVKRDHDWEQNFARVLPYGKFTVAFEDAKPGPDGWPYLFVSASPEGSEYGAQLLNWLSTRGIGLAINPELSMPDFVLTYGMTWNFKERGSIVTEDKGGRPQTTRLEFKQDDQVYVGQPTEAYLPAYVRKVIKEFLFEQGILAPKIAVIQNKDQTQSDLGFSLESLGSPTSDEHAGIAEAIAWFLPAHYSVALVSEKVIAGFQPL
jgi:hypothetical protein